MLVLSQIAAGSFYRHLVNVTLVNMIEFIYRNVKVRSVLMFLIASQQTDIDINFKCQTITQSAIAT